MREDQRLRLKDLTEKLADVVLQDADPANWSGAGVLLCDMTQAERGDAAWCRKTATQSVALLARLVTLQAPAGGGTTGDLDPDPETEIKRAEKAAAKALAGAMAAHGKA